MIIIAEVSELSRKIKLPTDRVLSVNGDYQVDGIAFKLPATYDGDFDFSTAAARVHWTGVDKVEHTNLIAEVDGNGYPLWTMPSELTQGGHGVIEFAVSFVATDETAAVTKRWISDPVSFRNRRTVNGSNEDEEAEEETTYDRLASAIATVRAAQAEVEDTNAVLSSLTGSAPVPVENRSDMVDDGHLYLYTGDETGLVTGNLYYYVNGTLTNGGQYGSMEVDATLTQSGQAADAKKTGDEISAIKEDLSAFQTATEEDVGKALKAKTVADGKVTEWEFGEAGGENSDQLITYVKGDVIPVTQTGKYLSANGTKITLSTAASLSGCRYSAIPCDAGDVFIINAVGGIKARAWAFTSLDGTVLSRADANVIAEDLILYAPTDAAYLVINDIESTGTSYYARYQADIEDTANGFYKSLYDYVPAVTWIRSKGVNAYGSHQSFGNTINSSLLNSTDYILLNNATKVVVKVPLYEAFTEFGTVFYNATKQPIKGIPFKNNGIYATETLVLDVPDDAAYIRTSYFRESTYGDFSIILKKPMVERYVLPYIFANTNKGVIADSSLGPFGDLATSTLVSATDYIPVETSIYNGVEVKMPVYETSTTYGLVFYDESKTAIEGHLLHRAESPSTEIRWFYLPDNAAYLRTCYWNDTVTYGDFSIEPIIMSPSSTPDVTVYPSSYTGRVNRLDYQCTGANDEKVIQQAINAVALNGGGRVRLIPGIYYIDSFVNVGDGGSASALYMPTELNRVKIVCEQGDAWLRANNDYVTAGKTCAVLRVTNVAYDSVSDPVSVIRAYKYTTVYRKSVLDIEGIGISIPNNQKPIIAIDGLYAEHMMLNNIRMVSIYNSTYARPVAGCIGVRGMQGSNDGICDRWDNMSAYGFREGFAVAGEHLICTNLLARECFYGFTFNNFTNNIGAWTHPITLINCADELNENMPYFGHNGEYNQTDGLGGRQAITMIDFNVEWVSSRHKSDSGIYATEVQPGEWYGKISYTIQTNKNAVDVPFWANDGSGINIKTVNDAQKQIVTTSERMKYSANEMQRVYDSTESKFYTYVNGAWVAES